MGHAKSRSTVPLRRGRARARRALRGFRRLAPPTSRLPLPFPPVPLTLQTFAVLLVGAALGTWRGIASMVVYAAAGTAGVPWFSAGSSGWGGASYGYILGFIVAAGIVGRLAEQGATRTALRTAGLMVIGNIVIYAIGVTYLKFAIDVTWATALSLGMVPFLLDFTLTKPT